MALSIEDIGEIDQAVGQWCLKSAHGQIPLRESDRAVANLLDACKREVEIL